MPLFFPLEILKEDADIFVVSNFQIRCDSVGASFCVHQKIFFSEVSRHGQDKRHQMSSSPKRYIVNSVVKVHHKVKQKQTRIQQNHLGGVGANNLEPHSFFFLCPITPLINTCPSQGSRNPTHPREQKGKERRKQPKKRQHTLQRPPSEQRERPGTRVCINVGDVWSVCGGGGGSWK